MTSLIRRFWFPYEQAAGRSLPIMVALPGPSVAPVDAIQDEAMFHDGNFDQSVASQVVFVGWRMHHACALSNIDRNPVV